ncbi:gamma-glutamyl-gamma-aminobutyrate hydrolase family protein [Francisella sp. 19X1-34]|uniref:gamma-glutamyl-gamma-aminobutyrate hydrolase family protein n=1 Tax=Francisella sp. 19X1-34 TaxID=3087177 RepID=UPI002E2F7097|nr:gamma-glutamyl-gamma-aminobutyrate hydrolase family protein [Francisella sp. 19X1-34]MED7789286.1 gamma-glutamyl-gamma-aminobutyrate hydrolase family protein [Francisella sp. 19X1-34]
MSSIIGTSWDYSHTPWTGNMVRQTIQEYGNVWRAIDYSREYIGRNISITGLHYECEVFKNSAMNCVEKILNLEANNINLVRALAKKYADNINSYIIPGGENIEPWLYGRKMTLNEKKIYRNEYLFRTILELFIINFCYRAGKPMLGICRGCQLLNIFFGGSLIEVEGQHNVTQRDILPVNKGVFMSAATDFSSKSISSFSARSFHHQAVDPNALPELLKLAIEHDGIIKAFENACQGFVLGVQFHPEYRFSFKNVKAKSINRFSRKLFSYFFKAVDTHKKMQRVKSQLIRKPFIPNGKLELLGLIRECRSGMSRFFKTSRKTKVFDSLQIKLQSFYELNIDEYESFLKDIITNALIIRNTHYISHETNSGRICLNYIRKCQNMRILIASTIQSGSYLSYKDLLKYIGLCDFSILAQEEFKRRFYFGIDINGF